MRHLVIDVEWQEVLAKVDQCGIPLELTYGTGDEVGDHDHARAILRASSKITMIPSAGHRLPMSHPDVCSAQLTDRSL